MVRITFARTKKFLSLTAALLSAINLPLYAGSVTIHVKDGSGTAISGAGVYAITNGTSGPDGTNSQVGTTDGNGDVNFTLDSTKQYDVIADKHGKGPTARVQYFSPNHLRLPTNASGTHEITQDQTIAGRGMIVAQVTNGSASKFLSGTIRKKSTNSDVAFGACQTDVNGDCNITFNNVLTAVADTYEIGVYDPALNRGNGAQVSQAVQADQTVNVAIDMDNGLPPDLSSTSGDGGGTSSTQNIDGAIVRGVVEDIANATITVPWGHIELMVRESDGQGGFRTFNMRGTSIDQNGRFEFVGLPANKYYVSTGGGCIPNSNCYKGYTSETAYIDGTLGTNDFEVTANEATNREVKIVHIKLTQAPVGTGRMKVKIRKEVDGVLGSLIPNSSVNLWPDHSNWRTTNPGAPVCNADDPDKDFNPGFTQRNVYTQTGVADLTTLSDGNYTLSAWTPYNNSSNNQGGMYNAGDDGLWLWGGGSVRGCDAESLDDLRLNVNGTTVKVFNVQGNEVAGEVTLEAVTNIPILTIGVEPTQNNYANRLHGTFTFPEVADLSDDAITLVLHGSCDPNCHSEFAFVGGEGTTPASSFTYGDEANPLTVPDGQYFMEVRSGYWGIVRAGGHGSDQVQFGNGITDIERNFTMAPAGRISGTLYKPDGSVFQPGNSTGGGWVSAGINVRCGEHSWAHSQVNNDGNFLIGGILPGECELEPQIWSSQSGTKYAAPLEKAKVTVVAGEDVEKNVKLVDGVEVAPNVDLATLPDIDNETITQHGEPAENFEFTMVVAGTPLDSKTIKKMLVHEHEDLSFPYVNAGASTRCGGQWPGGFCPADIPTGMAADFYLVRRANIEGGHYQGLSILAKKLNVNITQENAEASGATDVLEVPMAVQGITAGSQGTFVAGTVQADNFLRESDFNSLGGDFDNFINYIPMITAKNAATGDFIGAVLVTPPPAAIEGAAGEAIDQAVIEGDWAAFQAAIAGMEWAYQLRGLPAATDIILVGATPNYPPVFNKITTGADGTSQTWNIDWDTLAGAGGTISGVVTDASATPLVSASVVIKSPGIEEKTASTDANGAYSFPGLPKGPYKLTVSADSYAALAKKTVISGEETDTLNFALTAGPGSITGNVTALKGTSFGTVIAPVEGVTITAYDDTFNANNPGTPLALIKTQTDSNGDYEITGLIPSDDYVVALKAEGYYPERLTVTATNGVTSGVDFSLEQKPLQLDVVISHDDAASQFKFLIKNPQNFEEGTVTYDNSADNADTPIDISNDFEDLPDGSLVGTLADSALSAGIIYDLKVDAVPADGSPNVVFTTQFGLGLQDNAVLSIDQQIMGDDTEGADGVPGNRIQGGEVSVDVEPGTLLAESDTDLPTAQITTQDPDDVGGDTDSLVGEATEVTFNDVQFTENPLPFNIPFDSSNVDDITSLGLYQFIGNEWVLLTDEIGVDPIEGTVSGFIDLNESIVSQVGVSSAKGTRTAALPGRMSAVRTSRGYKNNPSAAATGSAIFAVGIAQSGGVSATGYHQYNFPNPFNLKDKTVSLRTGTTGVGTSVRGTYIVVSPTGSGTVEMSIKIFNVAGDMVREFKPTATRGQYNYTEWDGKNAAGDDVASGVYFAVVDAPGAPKKEPIKLVVVK